MAALVINVGRSFDGWVFELEPRSRQKVQAAYPPITPVGRVAIGYETRSDFEQVHGPIWNQVAILLTGLSPQRLSKIGDCRFVDAMTGRTLYPLRKRYGKN